MLTANNFEIRTMTRSEVDFAIDLAAKEGWNPGLSDAQCFYQTDPNGFLVGLLGNQPIGCISAISYGNGFGFIGLYIVLPEYRHQGYGIHLWKAALRKLQGHNIGLDGVLDQEPNYIKSGFRPAHRNIRFEKLSAGLLENDELEIVPLEDVSFKNIVEYDSCCFPVERTQFLRPWVKLPSSRALGYVERSQLKGYGVMRKCYQGYKIGPLFANNMDIADKIYRHLISGAEKDAPVYIDIPESQPGALALVHKYAMRGIFATTRMYSQEEPNINHERIFGVTTFELG